MKNNCKVISHQSAQSYWLGVNPETASFARPTQENPLRRCASTQHDLASFNTLHPLFGGEPVHLTVPSPLHRRSGRKITCHSTQAELPKGSFRKLKNDLFIASPELCYVQVARNLTKARAAELACNLCARFYIPPSGIVASKAQPITSTERIADYLGKAKGIAGVEHATKSLSYAANGSASPMETKLFLLLTLPKRMGGYGLESPTLNYRIDPGRAAALASQQFYVADLCWPKHHLVVEYDGMDYHQDASHDKRRTNSLESLGWTVLCITKTELFSTRHFDTFASQVASALGVRIRKPPSWAESNYRLRKDLSITVSNKQLDAFSWQKTPPFA